MTHTRFLLILVFVISGCIPHGSAPPHDQRMKIPPILGVGGVHIELSSPLANYAHLGLTPLTDEVFRVHLDSFHSPRRVYVRSDSLMNVNAVCVVHWHSLSPYTFQWVATHAEEEFGSAIEVVIGSYLYATVDTTAMMWWDHGVAFQLMRTEAFDGFTRVLSVTMNPRIETWCNEITIG